MRFVHRLLAVAFVVAAGFAWVAYTGQGIAIGALIGLPGRGGDISAMQRSAQVWLVAFALSEIAAVAMVMSLLSLGAEATRGARFVARGVVGTAIAALATVAVAASVFAVASFVRR